MKVYFCPKCESTDINITYEKTVEEPEKVSMDDLEESYDNYPTFGGWTGTSDTGTQNYTYTAKCGNCGYTVSWTKDLLVYVRCVT